MDINDINRFLSENKAVEIKTGMSGAKVYDINDELILKYITRDSVDAGVFDTYSREALFYRMKTAERCGYIPEVLMAEVDDEKIVLLMNKYDHPVRSSDEETICAVMTALARIHADRRTVDTHDTAKLPSDAEIQQYADGWRSVLGEHDGFDAGSIGSIAKRISGIAVWHDTEKKVLVHGDFHWDNLLVSKSGEMVVCDWQGVTVGGASGDISFFISRSEADGLPLDTDMVLGCYCRAYEALTGEHTDAAVIKRHMAAANVMTSFMFWHNFLHGNSRERVAGVLDRMTADCEECIKIF
ncbi:MAG: phosphotransferase [Oscillospiraceae bacterium]|nr:phosphotransferase [Oscillospiraceae bacterium]